MGSLCKRVLPLLKSSTDSPLPLKVSKRSLRRKVTTSCTTTILVGSLPAHPTWELVSVLVPWSRFHMSLAVLTSRKHLPRWVSKPVVLVVLTLPPLVVLGISPTPIVSVNPKPNWSTSSSKVVNLLMLNGLLLPSQPSSKSFRYFDTFCVNN